MLHLREPLTAERCSAPRRPPRQIPIASESYFRRLLAASLHGKIDRRALRPYRVEPRPADIADRGVAGIFWWAFPCGRRPCQHWPPAGRADFRRRSRSRSVAVDVPDANRTVRDMERAASDRRRRAWRAWETVAVEPAPLPPIIQSVCRRGRLLRAHRIDGACDHCRSDLGGASTTMREAARLRGNCCRRAAGRWNVDPASADRRGLVLNGGGTLSFGELAEERRGGRRRSSGDGSVVGTAARRHCSGLERRPKAALRLPPRPVARDAVRLGSAGPAGRSADPSSRQALRSSRASVTSPPHAVIAVVADSWFQDAARIAFRRSDFVGNLQVRRAPLFQPVAQGDSANGSHACL